MLNKVFSLFNMFDVSQRFSGVKTRLEEAGRGGERVVLLGGLGMAATLPGTLGICGVRR
jgi:hypothetical protein